MKEFEYIGEKILNAKFEDYPFKHLYIENLLSDDHLKLLSTDSQIKLEKHETTKQLIDAIKKEGYHAIKFPGCTTSVSAYLNWYENNKVDKLYNSEVVEAFGMAFHLEKIKNEKIKKLIEYLNSDKFHNILHQKFDITQPSRITTRIQKYLSGYEISPHPDIRTKCLTYLININTEEETETMDIHTHLLKFKKKYNYVYKFWNENTNIDRCWVPWDWCTSEKLLNKNNSLVMFAPANDTLHAVKLNYDHLNLQRTQLYGNLWYLKKQKARESYYTDLV